MASNIQLTKAMIGYARRHGLEVPKVSVRVQTWGQGKRTLAWRVTKHMHEEPTKVPVSQWRTEQLAEHFFPQTLSQKIAEQARKAVSQRWSQHTIQSWYGMGDVPWCAETWSYIKAKAGSTSPKKSYVPDIIESAAHGRDGLRLTSSPRPGDGVVYDWNYDHVSDHIETLLTKNGRFITTAAGNSGPPYVIRRYRSTANVIAWVRVER